MLQPPYLPFTSDLRLLPSPHFHFLVSPIKCPLQRKSTQKHTTVQTENCSVQTENFWQFVQYLMQEQSEKAEINREALLLLMGNHKQLTE